jgi:hypothetical protein
LAAVASLLGSGEMETLAQEIEQRDARVFQLDVPSHPVNGEADGEVHAVLRSMLWSKCIAAAGIRSTGTCKFAADRHIRRHPPFCKT